MKRKIGILLTVLLTIAILFACNPKEATRTPVAGSETITVTSQGEAYKQSFKLDFTKADERYTVSTLTNSDFHSCVSCKQCGIQEMDGEPVYRVHNTTHGGFQVHLAVPMKASAIKSMKMTYMADVNATESAVRIYRSDDTDLGTIQNDTVLLGDAMNTWRSAFLKIDAENIADQDGYVRSFQLVMRNKNNATFHIRELLIGVDLQSLCDVEITAPVKWEKGAITAIAEKIKAHFTDINCQATIHVSCDTYLQNSTQYDGSITYTAKIELAGGKIIKYTSPEKVIPKITGIWLENEGLPYGATQDTNANWEKDFLTSGMLTLSNRKIACEEGLARIEYAVLPQGTDYKAENVQWHDLQQQKLNKKGIKQTFLNAYLDYGTALEDGAAYTLYVRAVTNSENYILHIQKDFTYQPYNQTIATALPEALAKVNGTALWLGQGQTAKDVLENAIDNKQITITVEEQKGYSGSTYRVQLSYEDSKFKGYTGDAFTLEDVVIWNSQAIAQAAILPQSPTDGTRNICITADAIVQYMNAPYGAIIQNNFSSYANEEICTPTGVRLTWSGSKDAYTVKVSKDATMKNARTYTTTKNEIEIFNLETGATYYWQVAGSQASSPVALFTTEALPRYLKIDGVRNIRDLGGYVTTEGKRIKQGLVYRSANFDSITKQGRTALIEGIGLKTDLDLRGKSGDTATAPLGNKVQHIQAAIKWYTGVFEEGEDKTVADAFKVLANEENYPVAFHCAIGRDRTGTVAVLLLGLLGVDEETAMREYLMSMHSTAGGYTPAVHSSLYGSMSAFIDGLADYAKEGASFQKQVEGYLLEAGVTKEEIQSIRKILLED